MQATRRVLSRPRGLLSLLGPKVRESQASHKKPVDIPCVSHSCFLLAFWGSSFCRGSYCTRSRMFLGFRRVFDADRRLCVLFASGAHQAAVGRLHPQAGPAQAPPEPWVRDSVPFCHQPFPKICARFPSKSPTAPNGQYRVSERTLGRWDDDNHACRSCQWSVVRHPPPTSQPKQKFSLCCRRGEGVPQPRPIVSGYDPRSVEC